MRSMLGSTGRIAILTAVALAVPAWDGVRAATKVVVSERADVQSFADTSPHLLRLATGEAETSISVTTPAHTALVILFNAECGMSSSSAADRVNLTIRVDGIAISPTGKGSGKEYCQSNGSGSFSRVGASSNATALVDRGTHTVEIEVPASISRLGARSTSTISS
jgi:hypothetical protein